MVLKAVRQEDRIVDFSWVVVNDAAAELLGRSPEELAGLRLTQENPGTQASALIDLYRTVVEGGERKCHRLYFSGEGLDGWYDLTAAPLADGVVVTVTDIFEGKRIEQALRQNESRLRLLVDNITDLIALHDASGAFTYVTPSAERVLGYPMNEFSALHPLDLLHPEDAARVRNDVRDEVEAGTGHIRFEARVQHRDGAYRWMETTLHLLRLESEEELRILSSSRDVTDRHQAEQALAQANEELRQRNRELQDFAYIASHDLQEPLRKVRAFADLMREDYHEAVDEQGQYYLKRMQDAATRMSDLITALLRFSRITTGERTFESVDLGRVLHTVLTDLEIAVEEQGATVEVESEMPTVMANRTQMRQLFQNLISNAIKFSPPERNPVVRISAQLVDRVWRISVADNGTGFEDKYADRIFAPFERLRSRSEYAGTGMGLAICKRIVEHHHGRIAVQSTPGAGTVFTIELPADEPGSQPSS